MAKKKMKETYQTIDVDEIKLTVTIRENNQVNYYLTL